MPQAECHFSWDLKLRLAGEKSEIEIFKENVPRAVITVIEFSMERKTGKQIYKITQFVRVEGDLMSVSALPGIINVHVIE